jgi:OMF family outer membrane factor
MGYGFGEEPNNFLNFYDLSFVGVQLSIPIFNGTSLNKKISQKKLELDNTAWQKNLVSQTQTNQIDNWNRQKNIAFQSAQTAQKQIDLAENIYNQTALQQKNGTATLTEVLLAENAVREAQQLYLSAVIDYLKADLELKKLASAF